MGQIFYAEGVKFPATQVPSFDRRYIFCLGDYLQLFQKPVEKNPVMGRQHETIEFGGDHADAQ